MAIVIYGDALNNMPDAIFEFADYLLRNKSKKLEIVIDGKKIVGEPVVSSNIHYMYEDFQVFQDRLSYTFHYNHQKIELSVQLYENDSNYYRMFAYTKCNGIVGMAFSINLTRNRMSDGSYKLGNQLKFSERIPVDEEMASFIRKRKQEVLVDFLDNLGLNVTAKNEVIFGKFDPNAANRKTAFIGTSDKQLLHDFVMVALIKGHYMGNKGYALDFLPSIK